MGFRFGLGTGTPGFAGAVGSGVAGCFGAKGEGRSSGFGSRRRRGGSPANSSGSGVYGATPPAWMISDGCGVLEARLPTTGGRGGTAGLSPGGPGGVGSGVPAMASGDRGANGTPAYPVAGAPVAGFLPNGPWARVVV